MPGKPLPTHGKALLDSGHRQSVPAVHGPHNPEVVGSNPTPATKAKPQVRAMINDHGPDCFFKINPFKSLNIPYNPEVRACNRHFPPSAGGCRMGNVLIGRDRANSRP